MDVAPEVEVIVDPLVARYLEHVRVERRLAERTVALYTLDLIKLAEYAKSTSVELPRPKWHFVEFDMP